MTLSTASIKDLREKNTLDITEISSRLEDGLLPEGRQRKSAIQRLGRLYDRRIAIEETAITKSQRESYGQEKWDQSFVRLRDIKVPEGSSLTPEQLRTILWRMVPEGKFKRFQETFCDPHNFIVPKFEVNSHGRIAFVGNPTFKSVAACLVSVDRIPDEFAERTRLVHFSKDERRSPLKRLIRKADIEVIDKLKRLWDSSTPISEKDFRFLLVQKPDSPITAHYGRIGKFPVGLHGTLLYLRHDFTDRVSTEKPLLGPQKVRPLRIAHFATIFDAHRKGLHAARGYKDEQKQLAELRSKITDLRTRISNEWTKSAPTEIKQALREEVRKTLGEGVALLQDSVDKKKVTAHTRLALVQDGKDRLGRVNPGVVSSRMSFALSDLANRLAETYDKNGFNTRDVSQLRVHMNAQAQVLSSLRQTISNETDKTFSKTMTVDKVLATVVPNRASLETITFRPFSTYAGLLRIGCAEFETALRAKHTASAKQAAVKMHVVTKFFAAKVLLEHIKDQLVDPDLVPLPAIERAFTELRGVLGKTILKGVHVPKHEAAFKKLLSQLSPLQTQIEAYPSQGDKDDRIAFCRALRKTLDDINPEKLAWDLVPAEWRKA